MKNIPTSFKKIVAGKWQQMLLLGLLLFLFKQQNLNIQFNIGSPAATTAKPSALSVSQKDTAQTQELSLFSSLFAWFKKEKNAPPLQLDLEAQQAFITRFQKTALAEMHKFGIPASIVLVYGLVNSRAGTDDLSQQANNYFGLLCGDDWNGGSLMREGECARKYENAWASFRDNSLYLSQKYAHLTGLGKYDYKDWAREISRDAYSRKYAPEQIIQHIELLDLQKLDEGKK